jgi:hypothetical protein
VSTADGSAVVGTRPRPLVGALAGSAVALVGNTAVFLLANAIRGATIHASTDGTNASDLPYVAVVVASVLPLLVGAGVLWALSRFTRSALRVWTVVALALTVLSLAAPLFLPVDVGSKIALAVMHIVAGSSAVIGQRWAASRPPRTRRTA